MPSTETEHQKPCKSCTRGVLIRWPLFSSLLLRMSPKIWLVPSLILPTFKPTNFKPTKLYIDLVKQQWKTAWLCVLACLVSCRGS